MAGMYVYLIHHAYGCRTMLCQPSVTHGCPRHGAGFPFKGDTSMNILKYIMNVIIIASQCKGALYQGTCGFSRYL